MFATSRFIRSLVDRSDGQASSSPLPLTNAAGEAACGPGSRAAFLRSLGAASDPQRDVVQTPSNSNRKVVDLTLESVVRFRDDNFEHTAHLADEGSKQTLGRRPNYDNRKRTFLARQPPDRRKCLICGMVTVFVFL